MDVMLAAQIVARWTSEEAHIFFESFSHNGRAWARIAADIRTKTAEQVRPRPPCPVRRPLIFSSALPRTGIPLPSLLALDSAVEYSRLCRYAFFVDYSLCFLPSLSIG